MRHLLPVVVVISLLSVGIARAQRPIVVAVELAGKCPPNPPSIVMAGYDAKLSMEYDTRRLQWRRPWTDKREGKFPETDLYASLRLGGHRTFCRKAERDPNDPYTAVFHFDCDTNPANNLAVTATNKDSIGVSYDYRRSLKKVGSRRGDPDLPCEESGGGSGLITIEDFRLGQETLRLQFGEKLGGLELRPRQEPLDLKGKKLAFTFIDQRARGRSSPPLLSPVSMDLDQQYVRDTGLDHVTVEVQK